MTPVAGRQATGALEAHLVRAMDLLFPRRAGDRRLLSRTKKDRKIRSSAHGETSDAFRSESPNVRA